MKTKKKNNFVIESLQFNIYLQILNTKILQQK